jgi:hypothetical protein
LPVDVQQIQGNLKAAIAQFCFVVIDKECILSAIQVENGNGQAVLKFFLRIFVELKGSRYIQPVIRWKPVVVLLSIDGYLLTIILKETDG